MTNVHHSINYVELPSTDLAAIKTFYSGVFGWTFQDWGDSYVSFGGAEVEGGFELNPTGRAPTSDGALVLVFSTDLEATECAVLDRLDGRIFHVRDPSGNELAVWTPA